MERTTVAPALILALFVSLVVGVQSAKSSSKTIIVPDDYSTIQEAINAAVDGDTVFVKRGIYNETLVVNKTMSLIGEDREATIIDARKVHSQVILIEGNNITVANFTLGNSDFHPVTDSGWYQENGEGDGIRIYYNSNNNRITNCTIINCPLNGIDIGVSKNNLVTNNIIINSRFGILIYCVESTITNNAFSNTYSAIEFQTTYLIWDKNYTLPESNVIQGNQNITLATVPSPFPSPSPSSSPTLSPNADNSPYLTAYILSGITIIAIVSISLFVYFKKRSHAKMTDKPK